MHPYHTGLEQNTRARKGSIESILQVLSFNSNGFLACNIHISSGWEKGEEVH